MGKSEKKVKSNRINALRKQYDAFLEEDKKRRERNEYILEKLDNMRSCAAVVSLRHKPNAISEAHPKVVYNWSGHLSDNPLVNNIQLCRPNQSHKMNMPSKLLDETSILREISKKYILIPKLTPNIDNSENIIPTITTTYNDNSDWKSKYDILDELKNNEKEVPSEIPTQDKGFLESNEEMKFESKYEQLSNEYNKNELLEKDMPDYNNKSNLQDGIQKHSEIEIIEVNLQDRNSEMLNEMPNANHELGYELTNLDLESKDVEPNNDMNKNLLLNYVNEKQELEQQSEHKTKNNIEEHTIEKLNLENVNVENEYNHVEPMTDTQHIPVEDENKTTENIYVDKRDVTPIQVSSDELISELNNEAPGEDNVYINHNEYPTEIINSEEFTPNDDVQLQDSVNINPEGHSTYQSNLDNTYQDEQQSITTAEHNENPVVTSGIEAFDAEQREMFYNEQTDKNDTYNQEVTENPNDYNPEYTTQNENYQQEDQYAYYENTQSQQPIEINDNEETSQRYDQSYEEQYQNPYEQQQQEQSQHYEQYEAYDQSEQQYDQLQYEQQNYDAQQYVEQNLDNEQGFAEEQNDEIGNSETPVA